MSNVDHFFRQTKLTQRPLPIHRSQEMLQNAFTLFAVSAYLFDGLFIFQILPVQSACCEITLCHATICT